LRPVSLPHRLTPPSIKRLLLRESQVQPLCLVFEDLHWIDSETQALLDSLVESLPTSRVLLLVNYRPEYEHHWGGKTYYTQLRLDPLPPESAHELLEALLGTDMALQPLKQPLIERTEGNPFFLEESVRTLVETQVLAGERGAYRLARALPSIQVPATVQAVLAARIDRLPPEEKRLLQSASVIGKDVPFTLLQVIADTPEEDLRRGLTHLQAAEFLYEASLFPELEYTFKHALTHEVAYGSLLQDRRRALHARIVDAIERLYPDRLAEHVDQLAHHDLRFDLRNALWPLGELARVLDHLRPAETLATTLGDQPRLGRVFGFLGAYFCLAGDPDRGIALSEHTLSIAMALGDFSLQVIGKACLGWAYITMGDYRRATKVLRENVDSVDGERNRERFGLASAPAVSSRSFLVWGLAELGEFAEGLARGEEAIRIAEAADRPFSLIQASFGVGFLHLRKGDLVRAIAVLERGLAVCRASNLQALAFHGVASFLGSAYVLSGRLAEALPLLERVVTQTASMGAMFDHLLGAVPQGDRADVERAEAWYHQAIALAEELGMRPLVARCHLGLGKLYRRAGMQPQAVKHLTTAATMLREMDIQFWLEPAEAELEASG
jgi:tetratricopeptide (TPR) repeat protein